MSELVICNCRLLCLRCSTRGPCDSHDMVTSWPRIVNLRRRLGLHGHFDNSGHVHYEGLLSNEKLCRLALYWGAEHAKRTDFLSRPLVPTDVKSILRDALRSSADGKRVEESDVRFILRSVFGYRCRAAHVVRMDDFELVHISCYYDYNLLSTTYKM